jgi:hypothetical protein
MSTTENRKIVCAKRKPQITEERKIREEKENEERKIREEKENEERKIREEKEEKLIKFLNELIEKGKESTPIEKKYKKLITKFGDILFEFLFELYKEKIFELRHCPKDPGGKKYKCYKNCISNSNYSQSYKEVFEEIVKYINDLDSTDYSPIIVSLILCYKNEGHTNLLIINHNKKKITRYEPHGSHVKKTFDIEFGIKDLGEKLESCFRFYGLDYEYEDFPSFCPEFGFQTKLLKLKGIPIKNPIKNIEYGSCVLWSLLMLESVLMSNIEFERIYEICYKHLEKDNVNYIYLLRGFFYYLLNNINKKFKETTKKIKKKIKKKYPGEKNSNFKFDIFSDDFISDLDNGFIIDYRFLKTDYIKAKIRIGDLSVYYEIQERKKEEKEIKRKEKEIKRKEKERIIKRSK